MSGTPDGLEGFALATGVVQNRDTGFVVGAFADALREGIGHSRILGRFSGNWGEQDVPWTACSMTICRHPSECLLVLGEMGEIWMIGNGQSVSEVAITDRVFTPSSRGPMCEIRCIANGRAYAVGTVRQAYRRDAPGRWTCIDQTAQAFDIEPTDTAFLSIDGFTESEIYAVGWEGEIWQFDGSMWVNHPSPTNLALHKVRCAADGVVYAAGQRGLLLRGRHDRWDIINHDCTTEDLWGLEWYSGHLFVSTTHFVYMLRDDMLQRLDFDQNFIATCYHLSAADGILWSVGQMDVAEFDGNAWTRVLEL